MLLGKVWGSYEVLTSNDTFSFTYCIKWIVKEFCQFTVIENKNVQINYKLY